MSGVPAAPGKPPAPERARAPLGVRAYFGASAAWNRAAALLQAVYEGAWLGVLRREDLHAIDQRFYDHNPAYHDEAHNLRGLFPWEAEALEAFGGCRRILVIGAGGGREVLALARLGYEVEGYECNPALVAFADDFLPRQGCAARVRFLPRDEVPAVGEPFDGIVIGWSAYTLIPGRAHRIDLLGRLRPLARPGGLLLLSFFTRGGEGPRFRVSAGVANGIRAVLRRERAERGDALAPNFVHYFVAEEIAAELREAGWEPRRFTPHGPGARDSGWALATAPAVVR
ncbi:MAG TPA: class I SAM-dependent methyltransferase [Longimicrobium sp.]|nr:class I SAM-dependent methyltransferase [Longimicrobium sp.]